MNKRERNTIAVRRYYQRRKEVMRLLNEWRLGHYFGVSDQEIYQKYREIRKIVMCD